MIYIYALVDPRDDFIRYVGKTKNLDIRLRGHLRCTVGAKAVWISELRDKALLPQIIVLEETSKLKWQGAEQRWIAQFRTMGFNLFNISRGGNGPTACSLETKKKLSRIKSIDVKNIEHLNRLNRQNRGSKRSEATKQKIREAQLGRKATPEVRQRMSEAQRGRKHSKETKAKMSTTAKNSVRNHEVLELMRQRNIGRARPCSDETRKKIGSSLHNRKLTLKARERMVIA